MTGTYDSYASILEESTKSQQIFPNNASQSESQSVTAQSSQAHLGKRNQPNTAVQPHEGTGVSDFDKMANRPTTRSLTNLQKQLLAPEVSPKPKAPARVFSKPPPRTISRGKSAKQKPTKTPQTRKTKKPVNRVTSNPSQRVLTTKPSKSPRDSVVMAKLAQMMKTVSGKPKTAQERKQVPRGGRRLATRQLQMQNELEQSVSRQSQQSNLEVKAEAFSSQSSKEKSASQSSSQKFRSRVLRSSTKPKPKKRIPDEDEASLPRFKCSSSSSSSTPERRPAPARPAYSYKKKNTSSSKSSGNRGKYRKYSKEQKDKAILLALKENSYIKAGDIMKINPKNIKRWVTSGTTRRTGRRWR